jgi:phosphoribosylformylglycinamidine cyclo-ligase
MLPKPPLTYRDSGVDIESAETLIDRIRPHAARTHRPEVLAGIGGFGALIQIPVDRFTHPVLVAGTDGIGTKLLLGLAQDRLEGLGIDLVAMCANDVLVHGAEPLFFLDYYASGRIDPDQGSRLLAGISQGCELAGCALVGGETAEMPGLYRAPDFDLAGFCVGIVERSRVLDGSSVRAGDRLIGLASSGVHSNGFSLVRKLLEREGLRGGGVEKSRLMDRLLEPTRIYVKSVLPLLKRVPVHAMAHITGGGLIDNPPRVLPQGLGAVLDPRSWPLPPVLEWIRDQAQLSTREFYRTFNAGIGYLLMVPPESVPETLDLLTAAGEAAYLIGEVVADPGHGIRIE